MARVTGLGGVFYVVKDPAATQRWYEEMLGLTGDYGPQIPWSDEPHAAPYSLISHFADDKYIEPGKGGFMINLRVDDCDAMVEQLKAKGVEIFGQVEFLENFPDAVETTFYKFQNIVIRKYCKKRFG